VSSWSKIARRIRVPLGFAFAALYLWLARPSWKSMLLGLLLIIPGLLIRALASGQVQKNEQLATTGPYAYTRNPLYLGSMVLAVGFAVAARNWWIGVALVVMLLAIYLPVIRSEETFLRDHFPEFDEYSHRVPRLLPRLRPQNRGGSFSKELYWKHREYNATLGALMMWIALGVKLIWISR
jgi:protein-S-isoprenylcysteine O-methyltransferase Ste14